MESSAASACRRRASDAEQSVRWPYSATAEREPAMVKEEPEWGECGASEAAVAEGLYADHEVKDELVIGPELIQQQDVAFSIQNTLNRMVVAPSELKPVGGPGAAPKCTHTCPGEGPRCNTSHKQQFKLRGCSVRLERILMEHLPTCSTCLVIFHCKSSLQKHSCTHAVAESKTGEEIATHCVDTAMHHLKTESERLLQYSSHDAKILTEKTSSSDNIPKQSHTNKHFSCDICKKQFGVKNYLTIHLRTHTGEKPFSCDVCNSRFSHKSTLDAHKRTHTGEKPYTCDICKSRFAHRSTLRMHRRTHTGEKPLSCDFCNLRFRQRTALDGHRRTHTGEKPFSCDFCKSRYSTRSQLTEHRLTHTGEKPFSCDVCKAQFSLKRRLVSHKRTHTGEKPYSCKVCEMRFSYRSNLTVHLRIHTGDRRFSCDVCNSRFNERNGLNMHKRTHTGEKPFSCDICMSRFTQKVHLNAHRRIHTVPEN